MDADQPRVQRRQCGGLSEQQGKALHGCGGLTRSYLPRDERAEDPVPHVVGEARHRICDLLRPVSRHVLGRRIQHPHSARERLEKLPISVWRLPDVARERVKLVARSKVIENLELVLHGQAQKDLERGWEVADATALRLNVAHRLPNIVDRRTSKDSTTRRERTAAPLSRDSGHGIASRTSKWSSELHDRVDQLVAASRRRLVSDQSGHRTVSDYRDERAELARVACRLAVKRDARTPIGRNIGALCLIHASGAIVSFRGHRLIISAPRTRAY